MSYAILPPEVNSALLHCGAGSSPMLAAAAAWGNLAGELQSMAGAFSSSIAGLVQGVWQGPAAAKMVEAAAPYASWLHAAATHSESVARQSNTVAAAFETAQTATVHPVAIAANRALTAALARANFLGFNIPAIIAMEAEYEAMWATDVSAMFNYHVGASAAWSQLGSLQNGAPLQQLLRLLPGIPAGGAPTPTTVTPATEPQPPTTATPPTTETPVTGGSSTPTAPNRPIKVLAPEDGGQATIPPIRKVGSAG